MLPRVESHQAENPCGSLFEVLTIKEGMLQHVRPHFAVLILLLQPVLRELGTVVDGVLVTPPHYVQMIPTHLQRV